MKKPKFRNLNLVLRRKKRDKRLPESIDQTEDEIYRQSLMLRRFAKRVTGSEYIRVDDDSVEKT